MGKNMDDLHKDIQESWLTHVISKPPWHYDLY